MSHFDSRSDFTHFSQFRLNVSDSPPFKSIDGTAAKQKRMGLRPEEERFSQELYLHFDSNLLALVSV